MIVLHFVAVNNVINQHCVRIVINHVNLCNVLIVIVVMAVRIVRIVKIVLIVLTVKDVSTVLMYAIKRMLSIWLVISNTQRVLL